VRVRQNSCATKCLSLALRRQCVERINGRSNLWVMERKCDICKSRPNCDNVDGCLKTWLTIMLLFTCTNVRLNVIETSWYLRFTVDYTNVNELGLYVINSRPCYNVFISWPMTRPTTAKVEWTSPRTTRHAGWSEIIGRYNTPDTMVDIGPRKCIGREIIRD